MADEPLDPETGELTSRVPKRRDFLRLCCELNARGCRYFVVGGFAMIHLGLPWTTGDIDLWIDPSPDNESKVFDALATLPDGCMRELEPGDVAKFSVVRVADERLLNEALRDKLFLSVKALRRSRDEWPAQRAERSTKDRNVLAPT